MLKKVRLYSAVTLLVRYPLTDGSLQLSRTMCNTDKQRLYIPILLIVKEQFLTSTDCQTPKRAGGLVLGLCL